MKSRRVFRVSEWLRTWWLIIPEPRDLSMAFAAVYLISCVTGVAVIWHPPLTIEAAIGPVVMRALGGFLVLGAFIAMWSGWRENWLVERVGVSFMALSYACYGGLVFVLHITEMGSRAFQLGAIGTALALFFVRYVMIRRFTYRPRG